jgi:L-fuculose-phosphate aldolase
MNNIDFNPVSIEQSTDIIQQYRQALVATAREAYLRHLTAGTFGVISMRLPIAGLYLITPMGTSFEDIRNGETCLIDEAGNIQQGISGLKLPSETKFHLKCYMVRTDINAIAHLHPPHASAYALRGEVFELVKDTARSVIKEVLRVQCGECISRFCGLCSCRTDIRTSYAGVNVLLLKDDGIVTLGASLEDALNLADLAEKTAQAASISNSQLHT